MTDAETAAKEELAKSNEAKAKSVADASHPSTPTPTQEENDLAALGVHTDEHADDGSGPSPEMAMTKTRQSEPSKQTGGGYQTRAAAPSREPAKDHPQNHKDQHAAGKSQS